MPSMTIRLAGIFSPVLLVQATSGSGEAPLAANGRLFSRNVHTLVGTEKQSIRVLESCGP